ncbi:hypothetical protein BJF83_23835 [Nocardiopsis sp. CNR-923]|nr:hypothetical protein BJF83_23835 [Nocardiopsis sp. CNR-923]
MVHLPALVTGQLGTGQVDVLVAVGPLPVPPGSGLGQGHLVGERPAQGPVRHRLGSGPAADQELRHRDPCRDRGAVDDRLAGPVDGGDVAARVREGLTVCVAEPVGGAAALTFGSGGGQVVPHAAFAQREPLGGQAHVSGHQHSRLAQIL